MNMRPPKARLEDIAKHAGVGLATVDRVLNERGGVSERTTARVLDSARQLGTNRILPTGKWRQLSIEAVFARTPSSYSQRLNQSLQRVTRLVDLPAIIYRTHIDVGRPERLVAHLESVADNRDGIILFANDLPEIASALRSLSAKTVIVTISTDIPDSGRHCYVGIDNFNAGQSAAKISEAICRKGGRVLVIEPEINARAQVERMAGFRHFFNDRDIIDCMAVFNPPAKTSTALAKILQILEAEDDLRAVYSPTNSEFLEKVIEAGRHAKAIRSVAKIVHDLSPHSIENLRSGLIDMVIDSNPMQQAYQAVDFIARQHGYESETTMASVDFQLYTSENLPRTDVLS
ncbi:MAG: LacI family DNA-binding transcriptional regulator [Candidatus Puniceispirillaceae bacterium]|jgi:LacI family transcriptional regulator